MDYLDKSEMLTNKDVNRFERNKLFVPKEHFWYLLFQLMKHGTYTLHVVFYIFCSVQHIYMKICHQLDGTLATDSHSIRPCQLKKKKWIGK